MILAWLCRINNGFFQQLITEILQYLLRIS